MSNRAYGGYQAPYPRGRRRVRSRFFVFLAFFIALLVLMIWGIVALFSGPSTYTLRYGMLQDASRYSAIVLRDEYIHRLSSYSKVSYTATENQSVREGDAILTVYKQGYSSASLNTLEDIRREIARYQQENLLSGIRNADLDRFDEQIALKLAQIQSFVTERNYINTDARLVDMERDLRAMMAQRQEFIKTSQSFSGDAQLEALYEKEKSEATRIEAWKDTYSTPVDGRVSYIFDGFEYFLTLENLDDLTIEDVDNFIKSAGPPKMTAEQRDSAQTALFRVVNPHSWKVLLTAKESEWSFAQGTTVDISFVGYEAMTFSATVEHMESNDAMSMVVLDIQEDMGPLINARKLTAVLGGRVEGIMVPLSALKDAGAQTGVFLANGTTFVPVTVLGKDDRHALVMPLEVGALAQGTEISLR